MSTLTRLNKQANEFLASNGSEQLSDMWMDKTMQKALKSILNKSVGKLKDKNAPKRGKSAYLFFCDKERENVKKDHPDFTATQVTAELGKRWGVVKSTKSRAKELAGYEAQAASDKKRYNDAKLSYVPDDSVALSGKRVKKVGPKRPKSAYLFFCDKEREVIKKANPTFSTTQITSALGEHWKALKAKGEKACAVYIASAVADKERYEKEKAEMSSEPAKAKPVSKGKAKKQVVEVVEEEVEVEEEAPKPAAPVKGKKSGYQLFCEQKREEVKAANPKMKAGDVTKELAKMWKESSAEVQASFK